MAGLQDYLAAVNAQTTGQGNAFDLPYVPARAAVDPSQNTWIGGGISAGIREMRGMGGTAIEAVGKATGLQGLEQWGAEAARNNLRRAQEVGRPDLETAPWKEGGASVIPWTIYQGAKMLPTLAAMIGAGAATGGSGLVPAAAARLGAAAPAWLGGPAAGVVGKEALEVGGKLAGNVIGATLAGYLPAAGGAYAAAKESAQATGQEPSAGTAAAALGMGLPAAAIGAVQPQILRDILGRPVTEAAGQGAMAVARRLADDGIKGALAQVPIAAAQRTIEMGFRPDLNMGQKAHEVVDAAITGGVLGGVFGAGTGGLRELKGRRPGTITNEDLTSTVDGQLEMPLKGGQGAAPPQTVAPEPPVRPFQQLTDRQLDVKLENAGKGATLGVPEDVALFRQLQVERQLRQPELPLGEGYSDNLTAPIQTKYDLTPNAPPPPPVGTQAGLSLEGGSGLPPPRVTGAPPVDAQGVLPLGLRAPPTSNTPTIPDRAQLDMFARPRPSVVEPAPGQPSTVFDPRQRELMPVTQELPLGDRPAQAPSLGDPNARPLRGKPFNELERVVAGLTQAEATRPLTAEESAARQMALGELQARAAATPDPKQLDLGLKPVYAPEIENLSGYMGEPGARPQPQGLTLADRLQGMVGKDTRLPRTVLDAPDLPAALDAIDQAASKAKTPNWAVRAAERLGLDGTIDEKLEQARKRVQDEQVGLEKWRGEGPPDALNLQKAQSELYDLQQRKAAIEEMEYRRANPGETRWQGNAEGQDGSWTAFSKVPEPTDTPVFSSPAEPNFTPIADAPLKAVLERWYKRLGASADRLRVVQTEADLPEKVRQAALDQGVPPGSIRGAYSDGVGWLVRDKLRGEADVQEVIAHEMFGHGGAKAAFGDRFDRFNQLFDKAGGVEGVMRIAKKFGADAQLKDYIPEGSTPLDKARFFDEMLAQAAGKSDGKLQQTALAWAGKIKQSMISMLEGMGLTALARRMDTFSELDTAVMLRSMRKAVQAGYEVPADHQTAFSRVNATVPEANENMKEVVQKGAGGIIEAVRNGISEMVPAVRRSVEMLTLSPKEIATKYGDRYFAKGPDGRNVLSRYMDTADSQVADRARHERMNAETLREFERLPPKMQGNIRDSLQSASLLGLTPGRTWDQHADLHTRANAPELKSALENVNRMFDAIRQNKDARTSYEKIVASHQTQFYGQANAALRGLMQLDDSVPHKSMPSFQGDQLAAFRQMDSVHDPREAAVHFKAALDATRADAWAYVTSLENQVKSLQGRDREKVQDQITPIKSMLLNLDRSIARNGVAPYVHLGRNGDWFVGSVLKTGPDGTSVDPRSLKYVKDEAQRRGFDGVNIILGNENPNMFVRFETRSQAENWHQFMLDMQKQGHIQVGQDKLTKGGQLDNAVQNHLARMVPAFSENLIARLRDSSAFKVPEGASPEETARIEASRDATLRQVRDGFISMLPAESIGRFMARREGAQGSSSDFVRNQARRLEAGANALSALDYAPAKAEALAQAYSEVRTAESAGKRSFDELADMKAAYNEFLRKDSTPAPTGGSRWADIARSAIHSFLTAASPAYAMVQLTQLGVTGLPELGKRFGYMQSAKAMASVATPAFNILRVAMQEGAAKNGLHGIADMVITRDVLQKAGIPKDMQNFLLRQVNRPDGIQVGSQSRELGMLADADVSGPLRRTAQYANAVGFGAETLTRLVMAMSTYKLAKGHPNLDALSGDIMTNSMFNFGPANTSRLLDPRTGPFGSATGLAAVFLRFQSMLIEKLYREVHTAFQKTPEGAASRKFLAGHLAAMTVLGGTMALPMASVMARAADKLVDLTSEDGSAPYDVKSAWRGWLADVFGKEMGEIAARGLPRALGIDLSNRIGEQDILPFSRFLTDRRKAEDTIEDLALRMGGAGVATGVNIWDGMADIFLRGDYLQGAIKILPAALRNPATAYRMGSMGYVDEKNAPLPLSPSARSIAVQALGFTPSEMAEYRDDRQAMLVRKTDLETNAGLIRKHLATAIEQGDQSGMRTAMQQMVNHDRLNPAYAVSPSLADALAARQRAPLIARTTGVPMGGNIKDIGGWGLHTGYNWRQ